MSTLECLIKRQEQSYRSGRLVHSFYYAFHDFVPKVCEKEFISKVYEWFDKSDVVIITKPEFEEWQALKRLSLDNQITKNAGT